MPILPEKLTEIGLNLPDTPSANSDTKQQNGSKRVSEISPPNIKPRDHEGVEDPPGLQPVGRERPSQTENGTQDKTASVRILNWADDGEDVTMEQETGRAGPTTDDISAATGEELYDLPLQSRRVIQSTVSNNH